MTGAALYRRWIHTSNQEDEMKKLIVTLFTCGVAACAVDDRSADPGATSSVETSAAAIAVDVPWQVRIAPTGQPGEQLPAPEIFDPVDSGATPRAQNCVFIQWCDRPPPGSGGDGTICKVRPSCFNQCFNSAIVAECDADVRAVCGSAVLPKIIECF
jgi:hypothetical protein